MSLAPPARAIVVTPIETYFTDPTLGLTTLTDAWVDHIEDASDDATIRIAIFRMKDVAEGSPTHRIFDALEDVLARGVKVRVVAKDIASGDYGDGLDALETHLSAGDGSLTKCSPNCNGASGEIGGQSGINHNKFMTINKSGSSAVPVVFVSSANWATGQLESSYYNSAVSVKGDSTLHDLYKGYFQDLKNKRPPSPKSGSGSSSDLYAHFYPKTSSDPVASQIGKAGCQEAASIYVAASAWKDTRGEGIAHDLVQAAEAGCTVTVILQKKPETEDVREILGANGSKVVMRCTTSGSHVHEKALMIEGEYDQVLGSKILAFGSHNLTGRSLQLSDEVWMKVASASGLPVTHSSAFDEYKSHFLTVWARLAPTSCD